MALGPIGGALASLVPSRLKRSPYIVGFSATALAGPTHLTLAIVFHRILGFFSRHQRRLSRLVLVAGALFAALELWPTFPRETEVEFSLGPAHADVVELRVAYEKDDQALHGVTFTFPHGAPASVRHRLILPAGTFVVRCELRRKAGEAREITRTLRTPATGRVRIPIDLPPGGTGLGVNIQPRPRART